MDYQITWGESSLVVTAENESVAWAKFCEREDAARKHPNKHARVIREVDLTPEPAIVIDEVVEDVVLADETDDSLSNEDADS